MTRKRGAMRIGALLACVLVACEPLSLGTTWHVDNAAPGGDGTSWAQAWRSFGDINWALVGPGDTVEISGGTESKVYREMLTVGRAGARGDNIVIRAGRDPGHNGTVVIDGGGERVHCILLEDYVTVSGEVEGKRRMLVRKSVGAGISSADADGNVVTHVEVTECGSEAAPGGLAHGIRFGNADNGCEVAYSHLHHNHKDGYNAAGSEGGAYGRTKIHHNIIEHNSDDGIACRGGHDIYDNVIGDMWLHPGGGQGHPDGIQAQGEYNRIWNNRIYDCHTHGIFADPLRSGAAAHIRIYNNEIYRTAAFAARGLHMAGINVKAETGTDSISDVLVANNTIVDMGYRAIAISAPKTRSVRVVNNIIYNCRTDGPGGYVLGSLDHSEGVEFDYNLVHPGPSGGNVIMWNGKNMPYSEFTRRGLGQQHGQSAAPRFVSHAPLGASNDLHLRPDDTACTGKGALLVTEFCADKDGRRRLRWDIGCYAAP
ncbi:MAG: right-handed parallel beta-helix repeat-containing protein [Lentisphaerae bacterium]|nr:right-handed parallel beta-helix repeat-containing protein [Lentisphaerota bacterium]